MMSPKAKHCNQPAWMRINHSPTLFVGIRWTLDAGPQNRTWDLPDSLFLAHLRLATNQSEMRDIGTKGEYDLKFPPSVFLTSAATCPPENRGLLPLQHGICVVACFLVASIPPPPQGQTPNGKRSGLWIYSYLVYFLMWSMIMSRSGMGWHARWKTGTADGMGSGRVGRFPGHAIGAGM
jgi:hypothetical protein